MSEFDEDIISWDEQCGMPFMPKILVLDDEESMYRLCKTAFQTYFTVAWSPTKRPFLEAVAEHPEWAPDLVITDIHSPDMSGLRFLRELRSRGLSRLFPVIVMTGDWQWRKKAIHLGAAGFFGKPFNLKVLLGLVGYLHFQKSGVLLPTMKLASKDSRSGKPKLALLDDQEGTTYLVKRLFGRHFDVGWSPRKDSFLEQLIRCPDERPDVVITDHFSHPMDGIQFLEGLWQHGLHGKFPVIMVSEQGRWATAIEYGATDFIQKPFTADRIEDAVYRAYYHVSA